MVIAGFLMIAGGIINAVLTGFSLVDLLTLLSGVFMVLMKTALGTKLFPDSKGVNYLLSRLIILAISIAIIVVPLSFVQGKGSGKALDAVLEKSAELVERGEYDKAYKLLDHFSGGDEIPEILQNKGAIHVRKGECQEAEALINQAAGYKNMDAPMLFNIGLCYFQSGHYYDAANYFEKAALIQPDMWLSYYYAGEAFYRKKNYRAAEYYYHEVLNLVSDNPQIYYSLARTKMDGMDYSGAKELLDEARKYEMQQELSKKIGELEILIQYYMDAVTDNQ